MTEWKWRAYIAVPTGEITLARRNAIADVFVNNGSGESQANERRIFEAAVRLSVSGNLPATAVTLNTAVKLGMRDSLANLIEAVPSARVMVVDADTFAVVRTNVAGVAVGTIVTWEQWLAGLQTRYGLQVIPESGL